MSLLQLIPQKPPFVLIDSLLSMDNQAGITAFTIPEEHLLVEKGRLSEAGLLENIAQSAAAMTGFAERSKNRQLKVGYIASVKNLVIYQLPKCGQVITTRVAIVDEVMDFVVISGKSYQNDDIFAACEMKIYLPGPTAAENFIFHGQNK